MLHITPEELISIAERLKMDCAQMELDAIRCWGSESMRSMPRVAPIR